MKNKLTFAEMNAFISYVIENTIRFGTGYKQALIDYCVCLYYGDREFSTDDIAEMYDNGELNTANINIDPTQFRVILSAINDGIENEVRYKAASLVFGKADIAISNLAVQISEIIKNQDEIINPDEVNNIMQIVTELKGNLTADNLVTALVQNGIIKGKEETAEIKML